MKLIATFFFSFSLIASAFLPAAEREGLKKNNASEIENEIEPGMANAKGPSLNKPRLSVSLRFDKREVMSGEPIMARLNVQNVSGGDALVRFRYYDNPFFHFRFEAETESQTAVEDNFSHRMWELERSKGKHEPENGRLIELKDQESFTVKLDLRDYFDFKEDGLQFVSGVFRPSLLHSEDDYSFTILGDSFRFNKEAGELKKDFQSRSEEGLRVLPNADEANDTTKTFLSPDEVVRRTLENQQNKNWKRFIDGFDLAALLVNSYSGSDIYERYLGARADEKLVILDEFKNFLIQSLPYTLDRFDVAETKMSGNDARVNVGTVFKQASKKYVSQMNPETGKIEFKWVDLNYQDLVQEASMNYDLEKKNGVWRIIRMDVTLKKVVAPVIKRTPKYDKPKPIVLPDIRFMRGRAELLPSSDPTLDRLLSEMIRDPSLTIELYGHTDNVGDRSMNMILSLARADAVKSFLTDHGIKATRIKTQGFGPDKPIASNDEEEGRLKNRRVEFLPIKP